MNKPLDTYRERSRRVASLMAWLECEIDRHEAKATKPENAEKLWPLVGDLEHIEEQLIAPLSFLSGITEEQIKEALIDDEEGRAK
ncbi:MAG: hypothetical protein ABR924_17530 [Terracidiphilus sp.]|jgi:hypothetical protein